LELLLIAASGMGFRQRIAKLFVKTEPVFDEGKTVFDCLGLGSDATAAMHVTAWPRRWLGYNQNVLMT
jgi:hypothetical protein